MSTSHPPKVNQTSKVYPVRINMELSAAAADKAKAQGLGFFALINRLLEGYVQGTYVVDAKA